MVRLNKEIEKFETKLELFKNVKGIPPHLV